MGFNLSAYPVSTDPSSSLTTQVLQNGINILVNSASAAALWDYDDMFLDLFTDADGYDGTIDTANTEAVFNTNLYQNSIAAGSVAHGATTTAQDSRTVKSGIRLLPSKDVTLTSITKYAASTATTGYLTLQDGTAIASASFVGNTATFATPQTLTGGVVYAVSADSGGGAYTRRETSTEGQRDAAGMSFNGWAADNTTNTQYFNIESIYMEVSPSDSVIQTNAISVTTGATHHQVYAHYSVAGTGAVSYNISMDNGVTWDTDQQFNIKNVCGSTGTQMIIKLNANGTGSGNTAQISDYAVSLTY